MPKHLQPQTILGFDFGTRHIGIAVGQTITATATALTTISAKHGHPRWQDITTLVTQWQPDALVVGIPLNMDGTTQPLTKLAERFAAQCQTRYDLPVYHVDERLTTTAAKQQLFTAGGYQALQKSAIDSTAAKIIVESWLATVLR